MSVIDARECSVRRLQRLQALCAEPGDAAEGAFTSLLLVAGADGRDNWDVDNPAGCGWMVVAWTVGPNGNKLFIDGVL